MIIGIVSNSAKVYMPLLSSLFNYKNKAGVMLYVGKALSPDNNPAETMRFCNAAGIAVTFENNSNDLYNWQQMYQPDIVFFAGYGSKVNIGLLADVRFGIYNIHFGLLPEFRGPSPVFWQLKKGNKEIGLAIHKMTDKLDSGSVIWQYKIANEPYINYDIATQMFSELQIKGVIEILEAFNAGKRLGGIEQDESKAAYYAKPQLKDVMINWDEMDASEVIDLIKACNSWNMGAITSVNGMEMKFLDAIVSPAVERKYDKGTIVINNNNDFLVACKGADLLQINYLKVNENFIPARFAGIYGFKTGLKFISTPPG